MTRRPQSHILEERSINQFQKLIPNNWQFRKKTPDFGIDGEIEIFHHQNGSLTGLIFYVQLKATSGMNIAIDFPLDKLQEYNKYDVPVLVVRYVEPTKFFYAKWAHEIDPYYAKEEAKTIRIKFNEKDKWVPDTSNDIEKFIQKLRELKVRDLRLPLSVKVQFKEDNIRGQSVDLWIPKFNNELQEKYKNTLLLENNLGRTVLDVSIGSSELDVGFLKKYGSTLHDIQTIPDENFVPELCQDLILGIALAVLKIGLIDLSAKIIFTAGVEDRLIIRTEFLTEFLPKFLDTAYFEEVLALILKIKNNEDFSKFKLVVQIFGLKSRKSWDNERKKHFEKFLLKLGNDFYNLGNFYRGNSMFKEAIRFYLKAKRDVPMYKERDYFFGELAGCFFEIKKYKIAASLYKKALEISPQGRWHPLYVDSLMFSGRYKQALDEFQKFPATQNIPPEWGIKVMVLKFLTGFLGVSEQDRHLKEANLRSHPSEQSPEKDEVQLWEALKHDYLCGNASFNLGLLHMRKNDFEKATLFFVLCGAVQPGDLEALVNATICSFNIRNPEKILYLIINFAYSSNKDQYVDKLFTSLVHVFGESSSEMVSFFSEIFKQIDSQIPHQEKIPQIFPVPKKDDSEDVYWRLESLI